MFDARKLEHVTVVDSEGKQRSLELLVVRAVSLVIDCGCYRYGHTPRHFTVIFTYSRELGDGAFVRADGEHYFRPMDISGPVSLEIERIYTPI